MAKKKSTRKPDTTPLRDAPVYEQNVKYVAGLLLAAAIFLNLLYPFIAWPFAAWQLYVAAALLLIWGGIVAWGWWQAQRYRAWAALHLFLASVAILLAAVIMLFSGAVWFMSGLLFLLTLVVAGLTMVWRDVRRYLTAAVGFVAFYSLLDLFWSFPRYVFTVELRNLALIVIVAALAAFSIFATLLRSSWALRLKLTLAFVMVNLFTIVGVALSITGNVRTELTRVGNQALSTGALQIATVVDSFVESNMRRLMVETQLPGIVEYLRSPVAQRAGSAEELAVRDTLRRLDDSDNAIFSYALLDLNGINLVDTVLGNVGRDESGRAYFYEAILTAEPYMSDVLFVPNRGGAIYFSAPVFAPSREVIGVLRIEYSASVLQNIIEAGRGLAGVESFPVLLDENRTLLAHGFASLFNYKSVAMLADAQLQTLQAQNRLPQGSRDLVVMPLPALNAGLDQVAQQPYFATTLDSEDADIQQVAVRPLANKPWLVVFAQPQEIFLAPVTQQVRNIFLLGLLAAGISIVVAVGIAQVLADPLSRLTAAARAVAAGDLTVQAPVATHDETGQLAESFNSMTVQLQSLISGLERGVEERTQTLSLRSTQLQAVAEVGRAVAGIHDLDELLTRITSLISERFGFYHVGIFLIDAAHEYAVLRAANSAGGQRMLARRHRLKIGAEGIVGYVTANRVPRVALDVGDDAVYFTNPDLPETRSELALPLLSREQLLGVLDVQSVAANAFSTEDVDVLQILADQVAIAINNAVLFAQNQAALEAERRAYGQLSRDAWVQLLQMRSSPGYLCDVENVVQSVAPTWHPLAARAAQEGRVLLDESRTTAAVPIRIREQTLGVVRFTHSAAQGAWGQEQVQLMQTLVDQLSDALENARLYQDTQLRAARERLTGEITAQMRQSLDVTAVLQAVARELGRLPGVVEAAVHVDLPELAPSASEKAG